MLLWWRLLRNTAKLCSDTSHKNLVFDNQDDAVPVSFLAGAALGLATPDDPSELLVP